MTYRVLIRGAGDLATGVAHMLYNNGMQVVMTEQKSPMAVRRAVSFSEVVFDQRHTVEGVTAQLVKGPEAALASLNSGIIPILVDPQLEKALLLKPDVLVDAIMAKRNIGTKRSDAPLVVGLGPGFKAGQDVDAVIETNRGPFLGRVIWEGEAEANTGIPAPVMGYTLERVIRASISGEFCAIAEIGSPVEPGDVLGYIEGSPVKATISGVLRGLIREGTLVAAGTKIGDIDPASTSEACYKISDKAHAVANGVLEAISEYHQK